MAPKSWLEALPDVFRAVVEQRQQITSVAGFDQEFGAFPQLVVGDVAEPPGHLLGHADLQALPFLDGADVVARVEQRVEGTGVEPGGAAWEHLDSQPALLEVGAVDIGDLVFAASLPATPPGTGHRTRRRRMPRDSRRGRRISSR